MPTWFKQQPKGRVKGLPASWAGSQLNFTMEKDADGPGWAMCWVVKAVAYLGKKDSSMLCPTPLMKARKGSMLPSA